ncbi:DNA-directed RNA polymerase I subunit rpa43 [Grifola frondosa]|uniref:DNA-directed RNA polymerase I subunit rpa43 n=1 Tax=Grifola frondosa TaxID=5627 RepID=A0A1C7M1Q4_GRIFR|nr:DNA-directed RNA polymerase I subunit rpa43 [Grifola frondosa]
MSTMSQVIEQKVKKRKHAATENVLPEPSTKRPKKDSKSTHKSKKKDKGKSKSGSREFRVIHASMSVSIPPIFANNLRAGVEEMLDSMLMSIPSEGEGRRYIPALQGVVLAHDNLQFLDRAATIKADCPFANCRIGFDATVWSPQVGMKLVGRVNLCSPDHVSLLVHRTFNVSIPRYHIPADDWEFEYGPAENDPEFGPEAAEETDVAEKKEEEHVEGGGSWVHKLSGLKLGGLNGFLEFTVVGLTIANQMLSLVGSIQPDPFSPEHIPQNTLPTATISRQETPAPVLPEAAPLSDDELQATIEQEEVNSDEDTFQLLGRLGDKAAAKEAVRRAKEEEEAKKERKRKRKEAKAQLAAVGDSITESRSKKKKKS